MTPIYLALLTLVEQLRLSSNNLVSVGPIHIPVVNCQINHGMDFLRWPQMPWVVYFCYLWSIILQSTGPGSFTWKLSRDPRVKAEVHKNCWPMPPQETFKHSKAGLAQSLWGLLVLNVLCQNLYRTGERDSWRAHTQKKSCTHQEPGERRSDPTRDWHSLACECPESPA